MSKRRRSYSTRAQHDRTAEDGIRAQSGEQETPGLVVLTTPYRRLIFFASLTGVIAFVIASAVMMQ
jgi:hypothetical protein